MKKIQIIFTLLFCLVFVSTNAQTWDFTSLQQEDKEMCSKDANWILGTDRYCYVREISNSPLTANGIELNYTKGLLFTASAPAETSEGKAKIRFNYGSNRLELNGSKITLTIPALKAGQKVTVVCKTGKTGEARGLNVSNLTPISGSFNSTSVEEQTNVAFVTSDGNVSITTSGGMNLTKISVTENGGSDPITPSSTNDVAMNLNKNQMRVTLSSNDIKYYNTENLLSVDINDGNVTVNPANGNAADFFNGNVSRIAFAKAQNNGQSGEIDNPDGAIKIVDSKGWLESAYVKWAPFNGAESYNVYCNDKKIDQQLIRLYPTYVRADVLGLAAGIYTLKVVAVDKNGNEVLGSASTVSNLVVKNYNREGFAHKTLSSGVGAYNNDGTLKTGAKVFYVTAKTAKTIKTEVAGKGTRTGIQDIIDGYQGGQDKTPITFRFIGKVSLNDLDKISSSAEGLQVKGKNEYSELNMTFEGVGDDAVAYGYGFLVRNVKSVEFRNLAIMECLDDALSLDTKNSNVWIHNMDFFYGQKGGDSDQAKGDGTVDIKAGSKDITVAYNHFWDNGKSSMCGMGSESPEYHITYHHNFFDHSDSRHARVRTMSVHMFNNYYKHCDVYGVGATMGASIFMDRNYFEATSRPIMSSKQGTDARSSKGTFSGEDGGLIKAYSNAFVMKPSNFSYIPYSQNNTSFDAYEVSSATEKVPTSVVTLVGKTSYNNFDTDSNIMYDYSADLAEEVPSVVTGYYGAGRVNHGDVNFDIPDETVQVDGHHQRNPELDKLLVNYKSSIVKIYGEENNPSTGSSETGTTEPEHPDTPEGTILCTFTGSKPSSSIFSVTGNYSTSKGKATIDNVEYTTCVKMEKDTKISFTLTTSKKVTVYFADTETASLKIDEGKKVTSSSSTYSVLLAAGTHVISKGDSRNIFGVKLENAK